MTAAALQHALAEGVRADGRSWRVARAWPADLKDPTGDCVVELVDAGGTVRGARLDPAGVAPLDLDPALPLLAEAVADGWTVLAHRAGKRAVLRRGTSGVFRKLATPKATKRAVARAEVVAGLLAGTSVPPPPPIVAADRERGVLDLEPADGSALRAVLADPATTLDRADRIGRRLGEFLVGLAALRADPDSAPGLPSHDLADEAQTLARWVAAALALAPLSPAVADTLRRDADRVTAELLAAPPGAAVLAHRDLHDGQLLVDAADRLVALDWDTAAWADPALDLANLLAHLDLLAVRAPAARDRIAAAETALRATLRTQGHPAATAPDRVDLLRRASAVRICAVHAFRVR